MQGLGELQQISVHSPTPLAVGPRDQASSGAAEALWPRVTNLLAAQPPSGGHPDPLLQGLPQTPWSDEGTQLKRQSASRSPQMPSHTACEQIATKNLSTFPKGSLISTNQATPGEWGSAGVFGGGQWVKASPSSPGGSRFCFLLGGPKTHS